MLTKNVARRIFSRLVVLLSFLVFSSMAIAAEGPLKVIQAGTDQALKILRSAQSGEGPALRQRKEEILKIVDDYFDFGEMARRALGRPWKDQNARNQKEFVALFKQLLFNTYVSRVDTYTGSNEQVVYDEQSIEGSYALVTTRVLGYKNKDVRVDYRLRQDRDEWKVYDVVVEGISLVNNYRQQFDSLLTNESFDALLQRLREKVAAQEQD
jgi:phospholipid transport system substrate-binding protein